VTDITQGRGEDPGPFLLCLALSDCETRKILEQLTRTDEARNLLEWHFLLAFGGGSVLCFAIPLVSPGGTP
jgi:hypothetical protein